MTDESGARETSPSGLPTGGALTAQKRTFSLMIESALRRARDEA